MVSLLASQKELRPGAQRWHREKWSQQTVGSVVGQEWGRLNPAKRQRGDAARKNKTMGGDNAEVITDKTQKLNIHHVLTSVLEQTENPGSGWHGHFYETMFHRSTETIIALFALKSYPWAAVSGCRASTTCFVYTQSFPFSVFHLLWGKNCVCSSRGVEGQQSSCRCHEH